MQLDERGQPIYGERDVVDLDKMCELGVPFWLAGGTGSPEGLQRALTAGAAGIQVGTLFAYCNESGLDDSIRRSVLQGVIDGRVQIDTNPLASPTGYPFKVVQMEGLGTQDDTRTRICDLGYLRTAFKREDGKLGYRCSAEPVENYVAKGGVEEDTKGRRCLCNGLTANVGHAQPRAEGLEAPLVTSGDDLLAMRGFLRGRTSYSAADVIEYLEAGAAVSLM
jgi:NAD(P)H-dependent flavin oxidoreductase YrpB (nitropropane dioxygenase family)